VTPSQSILEYPDGHYILIDDIAHEHSIVCKLQHIDTYFNSSYFQVIQESLPL